MSPKHSIAEVLTLPSPFLVRIISDISLEFARPKIVDDPRGNILALCMFPSVECLPTAKTKVWALDRQPYIYIRILIFIQWIYTPSSAAPSFVVIRPKHEFPRLLLFLQAYVLSYLKYKIKSACFLPARKSAKILAKWNSILLILRQIETKEKLRSRSCWSLRERGAIRVPLSFAENWTRARWLLNRCFLDAYFPTGWRKVPHYSRPNLINQYLFRLAGKWLQIASSRFSGSPWYGEAPWEAANPSRAAKVPDFEGSCACRCDAGED